MVMRRSLATTLLAALLALTAGCGEEAGEGPPGHGSEAAAPAATLVSGTAAGGEVSTRATPLDDETAVASYVEQFRGALVGDVLSAADRLEIGAGEVLVAAVVAIGCDVPPGAAVRGSGADVVIVPRKVASPVKECLAPVTTVALAVVPA